MRGRRRGPGRAGGEEGGGGEGAGGSGGEGGGREDSPHTRVETDPSSPPHARRCVRVRPERPFRHRPSPAGARPKPPVSRPPRPRHECRAVPPVVTRVPPAVTVLCNPRCADREARPRVPDGQGGARPQEGPDGDDPRRDQRWHHLRLHVQGRRAGASPPLTPAPPRLRSPGPSLSRSLSRALSLALSRSRALSLALSRSRSLSRSLKLGLTASPAPQAAEPRASSLALPGHPRRARP